MIIQWLNTMESTPPEIDITNEVPAGLPGLHLSFRKLQTWLSKTDGFGDASPRITGSASTAANCSKRMSVRFGSTAVLKPSRSSGFVFWVTPFVERLRP
jgi:hypothetical protein